VTARQLDRRPSELVSGSSDEVRREQGVVVSGGEHERLIPEVPRQLRLQRARGATRRDATSCTAEAAAVSSADGPR
jgi:hypothetical protein